MGFGSIWIWDLFCNVVFDCHLFLDIGCKIMDFQFTFLPLSASIAKIFILMLVGYLACSLKFIGDKGVNILNLLLIRLIFPALIISKIISKFDPLEHPHWWGFPLVAIVFSAAGMAIGLFFYRYLKDFESKKEFICSCGFQNCGYLPISLVYFLFDGKTADKFLIFIFSYVIGFNLLVWGIGPFFLSKKSERKFRFTRLLNPPVVATILSLVWVDFFGTGSMPQVILAPLSYIGQTAFPLAMIVLGIYLCRYKGYKPANKVALFYSLATKLIFFPILVIFLLKWLPIQDDYKFFFFLQSAMPTAVSLVIIGSYVGANNKFFSATIFYSHLISLLSIPMWLWLYGLQLRW